MSYAAYLSRVESEIRAERARQDGQWGEQNHPDGTTEHYRDYADTCRWRTQKAADKGEVTWTHILNEEVAEAFAETDPAKLRAELIQAAAVIVAWIECMDRRAAPAQGDG